MGGITFQPHLAEAVIAGTKTVTRRLCSDNPRSPWWREECGLKVGRDTHRQIMGDLEGFFSPGHFAATFISINGSYDPDAEVWRVELRPRIFGEAI